MNYWQRSRKIIQAIIENGKQSVYKLSEQTGIPKSSIYRLLKGILKETSAQNLNFGRPQWEGNFSIVW